MAEGFQGKPPKRNSFKSSTILKLKGSKRYFNCELWNIFKVIVIIEKFKKEINDASKKINIIPKMRYPSPPE